MRDPLAAIAQNIKEELYPDPEWTKGTRLMHPEDGEIEILSGAFWMPDPIGTMRLSNHWHWKVIATGEKKNGYGGKWKRI